MFLTSVLVTIMLTGFIDFGHSILPFSNGIRITAPEASFVLVASSSSGRVSIPICIYVGCLKEVVVRIGNIFDVMRRHCLDSSELIETEGVK